MMHMEEERQRLQHGHLTRVIIKGAMAVHRALGPGFLESVYQKALAHELRKLRLSVACEQPIQVQYDGIIVGDFIADMLIDNTVLVENKAIHSLATIHEVQLVNYLTATGIEVGLLLNFGAPSLEIRRKSRKSPSREQDTAICLPPAIP